MIMRTLVALALALAAGFASGHADHPAGKAAAGAQEPVAVPIPGARAAAPDARAYFTDLELQTQEGRRVRFYSDVLANKVVLINVMFATCDDACPLITRVLTEVRQQIPELFGREVHFVSITSDPAGDTPAALKKFAVKNEADVAGWTFLTGRKENVEHILKKLGQFAENKEEHSTLLIAGNVAAKRWTKIRPDAPPAAIAERLKLLAAPAAAPQARRN